MCSIKIQLQGEREGEEGGRGGGREGDTSEGCYWRRRGLQVVAVKIRVDVLNDIHVLSAMACQQHTTHQPHALPHLLSRINRISFTRIFMFVAGDTCRISEAVSNPTATPKSHQHHLHLLDCHSASAAHHTKAQVIIIGVTPARKCEAGVVHRPVYRPAGTLNNRMRAAAQQ